MILGFHIIVSAYGFWLPNDPRGSWSEVVREFPLRQYGAATKVSVNRNVAAAKHDYQLRMAAKRSLRYPPVQFTGKQAVLIAQGFATAVRESGYRVHALAILPDHTHLVLGWQTKPAEQIAQHLKSKATRELTAADEHPLQDHRSPGGRVPSPWGRKQWIPFISSESHLRRAIRYVEQNPVKAGLRRQRWNLVVPYEP
ncbi:hypothetical protein Pla123a_16060 [Posidoniimonas polymericola]|uniref:Transposase IS200 like protein n=1 Tax=Posidoniimonas polymericola TaxID=2528002 RepID=A0A5C5YSS3_9BACT|nr:hypothetical protein [Posidoniimonas polymericola]TWT77810.1 hypothetical protein Pla123a_16060 [Posidoniimonas polymericola]